MDRDVRVKVIGRCRAAPRRIVVAFTSAKEAVARLFAVAPALVNDWERFEAMVDVGASREDPSDG